MLDILFIMSVMDRLPVYVQNRFSLELAICWFSPNSNVVQTNIL